MKQVFTVFLLLSFLMIFRVAAAEMTTLKEYDEHGNCMKEMYFENEQPFFYNDNCYGLSRAFEDGKCISITYLDADGNPMLNKSGYARVDRELDDAGHVVKEMYFGVDGKPKALWGKHYGLLRSAFDECGNCIEYSYLEINGNPMVITSGYTTVKRTFNEDNKVDANMYYDADGQPVKLSLGQYGDKHRYDENGKDVEITYLGIDGCPIRTNSGYTSIKREYGENGKISSEWYYGLNGEQTELRRGQYGTRLVYEGSKVKERVPIDKEGNAIFLLDQWLPQHPGMVVLGAVAVVCMCTFLPRHWRWALLILYVAFIFYMTLYVREAREDPPVSLELFRSVRSALEKGEGYSSWAQIVHNILLFVPLCFIITMLQTQVIRQRLVGVMIACVLFSMLIEGTQYITGLGWMELDDVILERTWWSIWKHISGIDETDRKKSLTGS